MQSNTPRWDFVCAGGTWTWRSANTAGSRSFHNLGSATMDAAQNGFVTFGHYWTVTLQGRTMHHRPGKMPVNLPSGQEPSD